MTGVSFKHPGIYFITDPTIIAAITNNASWTTGDYTGSTSGIGYGDMYYDDTTKVMYMFNGSKLFRWQCNNITL